VLLVLMEALHWHYVAVVSLDVVEMKVMVGSCIQPFPSMFMKVKLQLTILNSV
jgi:hypothetical protein